jgi:hypothetical protein
LPTIAPRSRPTAAVMKPCLRVMPGLPRQQVLLPAPGRSRASHAPTPSGQKRIGVRHQGLAADLRLTNIADLRRTSQTYAVDSGRRPLILAEGRRSPACRRSAGDRQQIRRTRRVIAHVAGRAHNLWERTCPRRLRCGQHKSVGSTDLSLTGPLPRDVSRQQARSSPNLRRGPSDERFDIHATRQRAIHPARLL